MRIWEWKGLRKSKPVQNDFSQEAVTCCGAPCTAFFTDSWFLTVKKGTNHMKLHKTRWIAHAAMIAAIYIIVTWLFAPFGFGEIQVRISEALTILPAFTPAAVPGLFVGCLIGNILGGAILPDIIFGSLATLIGAVLVYRMRDKHSFLLPLPPILSNTLIVPFVLRYGYGVALPLPLLMFSIGIGELISCGVLGMILHRALSRYRNTLFHSGQNQ